MTRVGGGSHQDQSHGMGKLSDKLSKILRKTDLIGLTLLRRMILLKVVVMMR